MKKNIQRFSLTRLSLVHKAVFLVALSLFAWWIYPYLLPPLVQEDATINIVSDGGSGSSGNSVTSPSHTSPCGCRTLWVDSPDGTRGRRRVCNSACRSTSQNKNSATKKCSDGYKSDATGKCVRVTPN